MLRRRRDAPPWTPNYDLATSVVCWAAAGPRISKKGPFLSRVGLVFGSGGFGGPFGMASGGRLSTRGLATDDVMRAEDHALRETRQVYNEGRLAHMAPYQLATIELAEHLSVAEVETLRSTGVLPEWFWSELETKAGEIRSQLP